MTLGIALKDVKCYWRRGRIKRDGKVRPINKVRNALKEKHKKMYGHSAEYRELTEAELDAIIYGDVSRIEKKKNTAYYLNKSKLKIQKEIKALEVKKLREERMLLKAKMEYESTVIDLKVKKLMEKLTPEECNVVGFSRMTPSYVLYAIMAKCEGVLEHHAKLIVGAWIKRGLI